MTCESCRRLVRQGHPECDGDPRATCTVYGCGLVTVTARWVEIADREIWLRYCQEHQ